MNDTDKSATPIATFTPSIFNEASQLLERARQAFGHAIDKAQADKADLLSKLAESEAALQTEQANFRSIYSQLCEALGIATTSAWWRLLERARTASVTESERLKNAGSEQLRRCIAELRNALDLPQDRPYTEEVWAALVKYATERNQLRVATRNAAHESSRKELAGALAQATGMVSSGAFSWESLIQVARDAAQSSALVGALCGIVMGRASGLPSMVQKQSLLNTIEAMLGVCSAAEAAETLWSRRKVIDMDLDEFAAFKALTAALNAPALSNLRRSKPTVVAAQGYEASQIKNTSRVPGDTVGHSDTVTSPLDGSMRRGGSGR